MVNQKTYLNNKKIISLIFMLIAVMLLELFSYAWFYNQRGMASFTHVSSPSVLAIKGYNETVVEEIKLSTVDLADSSHKASFVFCVTGKSNKSYDLELAYTTNVPFKYTIRPTTQQISGGATGDFLEYQDSTGTYYYSTSKAALDNGKYINVENETNPEMVAIQEETNVGDRHENAYGSYSRENVQIHAEPVFYLFSGLTPTSAGDSGFVDYYILELTWDDDVANSYQKETDLVYLLASN